MSTGSHGPTPATARPRELDVVAAPQPVAKVRNLGGFSVTSPPAAQEPTGFYTDTTVCIGCKACEVACKQWNQLPADGLTWLGNSYDNTGTLSATSWRHVKFVEQFLEPALAPPRPDGHGAHMPGRWLMMSDVCKHCAVAPCQQACPTGALVHTEFTSVYIQPDVCNGCAYCIAACPFGVITRSEMDGHAHKCTLCYDRQRDGLFPACAKACPTASIQFGPLAELRSRAAQRVADLQRKGIHQASLYGERGGATYSELGSFYLLIDRPAVYGLPEEPFNPWLNMLGDYARSAVSALLSLLLLLLTLLVLRA